MYLDPNSSTPLFQQLHDAIVYDIATGQLSKGTTLSPVRKVAASFGINPATVKKAYDLLQEEGIVETRGRSGTVVTMSGANLDADFRALLLRAYAAGLTTAHVHALIDDLAATIQKEN